MVSKARTVSFLALPHGPTTEQMSFRTPGRRAQSSRRAAGRPHRARAGHGRDPTAAFVRKRSPPEAEEKSHQRRADGGGGDEIRAYHRLRGMRLYDTYRRGSAPLPSDAGRGE